MDRINGWFNRWVKGRRGSVQGLAQRVCPQDWAQRVCSWENQTSANFVVCSTNNRRTNTTRVRRKALRSHSTFHSARRNVRRKSRWRATKIVRRKLRYASSHMLHVGHLHARRGCLSACCRVSGREPFCCHAVSAFCSHFCAGLLSSAGTASSLGQACAAFSGGLVA